MTDVSYIVNSKVKEAIKAAGCNTSADALPAMNALAAWHISEATTRASSNGRKTVRSHDFLANASGAGAFVTISKVKEAIKAGGCNTAGDALEGLNACIASAIESARLVQLRTAERPSERTTSTRERTPAPVP